MEIIDKILEQICDNRWHNIDEIKNSILLPSDKLYEVLSFLETQEFISKEKDEIKITIHGQKFLALGYGV